MKDLFAVLGVARTASDREIKEAYRRLAKAYHPDAQAADAAPDSSNAGPTAPIDAAARMREINDAKDVLSDPVRRSEHLRALRVEEARRRQPYITSRFDVATPYPIRPMPGTERPRSKWDRLSRRYTIAIFVLLVVGSGVMFMLGTHPGPPPTTDPIALILRRHASSTHRDTARIPGQGISAMKRHGDLLFRVGEFRAASRYYEGYLRAWPEDDSVIKYLALSYKYEGRYPEALEVISTMYRDDAARSLEYYGMGETYLQLSQPFDAHDAFLACVQMAARLKAAGRPEPPETELARARLKGMP